MSRGRRYIEFEGMFSESVLGIFTIIRGFADLRDLAAVSVAYQMTDTGVAGQVAGHQRELDPDHAQEIKRYLEQSDNRFMPEVILSVRRAVAPIKHFATIVGVRTEGAGPISIDRRFSGPNFRVQKIRVQRNLLQTVKAGRFIRRIDGNHRLALAEQLRPDARLSTKYLAPFCMVLLGPTDDTADDFAESLIFHTINSTALPLESEHGLRLLLGQNPAHAMTPDNEFAYNPALHLTRLMADRLRVLHEPARQRFGNRPLTALWESARNLIAMDQSIALDRQTLTTFADNLFGALADIATRLTVNHPSLCGTYGFFELAARVWRESVGADHNQKVGWSVDYLDRIGRWLGSQGITSLLDPTSPAQQLLATFKAAQATIPKRVFLARWYPKAADTDDALNKANLRLQQLQNTLTVIRTTHGIELALKDLGTEEGGTVLIHNEMYEAIASSDIIICDLTGLRPNVCIEAGFALKHHEKGRLLFYFAPTQNIAAVPFDLSPFRYEAIAEAAEITTKVKPHIEAILREAGAIR